jgi:predicted enzyme related to lactoylglutathione lyase
VSPRPTPVTGSPCWVDLQTSSTAQARSFYARLLGWEAAEPSAEFGGYFMFTRNGVPVAGGMAADAQAPVSDVWSVYLSVPDAAKTLESAVEHGGQIVVQPMPVADLGTMGFLLDPGGAAIGLWQPGTFSGTGLMAEHGAPGWFELLTRDYERSVTFYRDVFGWNTQVMGDSTDFRMSVQVGPDGGDPLCGVMDASTFLPEGIPSHWGVYFAVDDTDAAISILTAEGGQVIRPAGDTPYGRIATVTDPMGAHFSLVGPSDAMPARQA